MGCGAYLLWCRVSNRLHSAHLAEHQAVDELFCPQGQGRFKTSHRMDFRPRRLRPCILGRIKTFCAVQLIAGFERPHQKQAPIPHAETLTIEELAKKGDIELDTILQNLKAVGIEATPSDIFGTIADQQNLSPNELFEIATGQQTEPATGGHGGGGFGQKTLQQACEEIGVEPEKAIEALKTAGVEATADMRIREMADQGNMHPSQIRQILENL